jgi:hypothetical protein
MTARSAIYKLRFSNATTGLAPVGRSLGSYLRDIPAHYSSRPGELRSPGPDGIGLALAA